MIKREYKVTNLDLFAGYSKYVREIESFKKTETIETDILEPVDTSMFPSYMGKNINIKV